ncbi:hypothetical protein QV65_22760 [Rhodococcus erythropolis]|nr:hypothetical protein QV65_22760 [Rhodococcus erythropolis]
MFGRHGASKLFATGKVSGCWTEVNQMRESGLYIPRNPLHAWFATSWWLALVSLGTSLVSGSLAIVVIALLTLAVVTLPFALVGVLVLALMIPRCDTPTEHNCGQ